MKNSIVLKVSVIRPNKPTKEIAITKKHLFQGTALIAGAALGGIAGTKFASEFLLFNQNCITGFLYM